MSVQLAPSDDPRGRMVRPLYEKLRAYLYVEPVGEENLPAKRQPFVRDGFLCRMRWGKPPDAWKRRPTEGEFRVWYCIEPTRIRA